MQSTLSLPTRILHFSPPKGLKRALRAIKHLDYMTSDYKGEFESDIVLDLTKATPGLAPFDLIFCYHVLEHIEDDKRAMDTMFQLLKPGGHLWVQTPFTEGELQEDFSIQAPHDREKYFGQVDHVRIYSVDVLKSRLEKAGFEVELKLFESGSDNPAGLLETETVILASKKNEL
jgi:SAM-dependent methyltransferase